MKRRNLFGLLFAPFVVSVVRTIKTSVNNRLIFYNEWIRIDDYQYMLYVTQMRQGIIEKYQIPFALKGDNHV